MGLGKCSSHLKVRKIKTYGVPAILSANLNYCRGIYAQYTFYLTVLDQKPFTLTTSQSTTCTRLSSSDQLKQSGYLLYLS